jgi:hypothetical protein
MADFQTKKALSRNITKALTLSNKDRLTAPSDLQKYLLFNLFRLHLSLESWAHQDAKPRV